MATIRGYIGASLDGYIASPDGTLGWLRQYETVDMGDFAYDRFITGIRTIVMGRGTYDEIARFHAGWPYHGKRAIVVTSRPIAEPVGPIEIWDKGVGPLVAHLRALEDGDVWMMGGGQLQQAFIGQRGLDRLEHFMVPEIVGHGIPLFPPNGIAPRVRMLSVDPLPAGCVRLHYAFD